MTRAAAMTAPSVDGADQLSRLEHALFFVLLALLCARPLISESFERVELPFLTAMGVAGGSTLATSAWLDLITLIAATAVFARRGVPRRGASWVLLGTVLLAAAWTVSLDSAGEKRVALNAGLSLFIGVLSGGALVRAMRAPWMPRLLLAGMLATGATTALKCLTQRAYEFDDTLSYWNEHKPELARRGVNLDDPAVVNFERRMRAGDTFAYQPHPNVTGSLLMTWLLAAGGVLVGWLAARDVQQKSERAAALIMCTGLCTLLAVGLVFTGSAGALVALAAGIVLLICFGARRRVVAARAGWVTALLAAGYLVVVALGAAYGIRRGTLPHPSLAFRWYYWTAAIRALGDARWTGIGRCNFGDAYLLHKPVEGTEEVRDPHNLWLSLLVELGPLGLAAGSVLVAGCWRGVLRRLNAIRPNEPAVRISVWQIITAAAGVLGLHALFWGEIVDASTALLWSVQVAAVWILALVLAARLIDHWPDVSAANGWQVAGLAAALGAALVHGLIDFALLTPAGLSAFVALAACAFAPQAEASARLVRPLRLLPTLAGLALAGGHLALVVIPTTRTQLRLAELKSAALNGDSVEACRAALEIGWTAVENDPLDPAPAREAARVALWLALHPAAPPETQLEFLETAREFATVGLARNPRSSTGHAGLANIYEQFEKAYRLAGRPQDCLRALRQAGAQWERVVALDPTDPRNHISAGRILADLWLESDDPALGRTAAQHFLTARRVDATRQAGEAVRLRASEQALIEDHLRMLREAGCTTEPAPGPASHSTSAPAP